MGDHPGLSHKRKKKTEEREPERCRCEEDSTHHCWLLGWRKDPKLRNAGGLYQLEKTGKQILPSCLTGAQPCGHPDFSPLRPTSGLQVIHSCCCLEPLFVVIWCSSSWKLRSLSPFLAPILTASTCLQTLLCVPCGAEVPRSPPLRLEALAVWKAMVFA